MPENTRDASVALLLSCLDATGEAWHDAIANASEIDWPWVLDRARAHKLIGVIAYRLQAPETERLLPDAVRTAVATERQNSAVHLEKTARTLQETRALLARINCEFVAVKGSVYAHDLYDDRTMRRFSDIDIVVPRSQLNDVDQALLDAGYFFWCHPDVHDDLPTWFRNQAPPGEVAGSNAAARRIFAAFHRHYLYVLRQDDPRMHVEVHWHLFLPTQGRASMADIWAHTRETVLDDVPTRTMDWEASLIHASVQAVEQFPTEYRLLPLCDVAWMLVKWRDRIDRKKLAGLAQAWGLTDHLSTAVAAVSMLLPRHIAEQAHEIWPVRSAVRRKLLTTAGIGPWIVSQHFSTNRYVRLASALRRECAWELAIGQPPRTAARRLRQAIRVHFPAIPFGSATRTGSVD